MKRRFLAPEVIQTSFMDCGPASLKSLLEGFGISASYGRLREACQTDVDGTSIDVLEDLAVRLGLDATQVMVPIDQLTIPEVDPFPAVLVTKTPNGAPHFVVAWRRVGQRIQVMDPTRGRIWMHATAVRTSAFVHRMAVPAAMFRGWAESEEFQGALAARFAQIDARAESAGLRETAARDPSWHTFAALDAALRMVQSLVASGAVPRGASAASLVAALAGASDVIPPIYWSASPAEPSERGEEQVTMTGAVLVRVHGLRAAAETLSPELEAAIREPPARPLRHLVSMLREDGALTPTILGLSLGAAALGGALEALLLRSVLDVGRHLGVLEQRLAGLGLLAMLFALMLALDLSFANGVLRMGRRLETRLRVAFLTKIPRLHDRYFQSRPASDMAHRGHTIHPVRELPQLGGRLVRSVMDLAVAGIGLVWIDPRSAPAVALAALGSVAIPWLGQRALRERDLRVRSFDGALSSFYLDALLGLLPVRAHGAERALRSEHRAIAVEWARAGFDRLRASIAIEGAQQIAGVVFAVYVVFDYFAHTPDPAAMLLLLYWALAIPSLGQEIVNTSRLYPGMRNRILRLVEPLGALEEDGAEGPRDIAPPPGQSEVHLRLRDVSVRASGHTILDGVNLDIAEGCHVAIVGPSGAGKSSLVGLLLGWHRPSAGEIFVDGLPLRGEHRQSVRRQTAWIDPAVHLWNRSLLANLEYGSDAARRGEMADVLEGADLLELVERLPRGLQTELGEGGTLVAGGEGQRVRLGRAMLRPDSRLVILDEAFRGLSRESRRALVSRTRARWKHATFLCVTHDVRETRDFDRVLVIEEGRVREDGAPEELFARPESRYRTMFDAEERVQNTQWSADTWRRISIQGGHLTDGEVLVPRREGHEEDGP